MEEFVVPGKTEVENDVSLRVFLVLETGSEKLREFIKVDANVLE